MKKRSLHFYRTMLAKILVVLMLIVTVITPAAALVKAAVKEPSLTHQTRTIFIGQKFNLNVKNKIRNSNYEWSSSNNKVATVTQEGVVTGIITGNATILCKVTANLKIYNLTCEVKVVDKNGTPCPTTAPTTAPTAVPTAQPTVTPTPDFIDLNQSAIVEAMGAGWNLGNQMEATNADGIPGETYWGNPVITEDLIKMVKDAGFRSIRIPVSYMNAIGPAPDYTIDASWLNRIQEVVDYCMKNGIYAIIDMHHDGNHLDANGWLFPNAADQDTVKAKYRAVWTQIAVRFKNYDEHLIFESMNEVFDGVYNDDLPPLTSYANINEYNQIFVDTVRQAGGYNDKRWVMIPGWNTDIIYTTGNYGFVMPTDHYLSDTIPDGEKRIMISVHYYSPWDFCGGSSSTITQWGESATDPARVLTHSGQNDMAANFKLLYDAFTSKGYPVVIGEYGSIDKSDYDPQNNYYRAYFARKVCENSVKYGCIPMMWDNGYNGHLGFSIFDRNTREVTEPEIVAAVMSVYYGSPTTETSTGISLDKNEISMEIGDAPVSLSATLTPLDSADKVTWTSSDETIATISDRGVVRAYSLGTSVITASANGNSVQCIVNVIPSHNFKVALYALETNTWNTIKSSSNAEISTNGGSYTLTMTGSQTMLSQIGALYIKDIQVQSGAATTSMFSNAKIKVDSVLFNGVNCTVTQTSPSEAVSNGVLDFSILNQWAPGSKKIEEAILGNSGSYEFTIAPYQEVNTIEVTFTVSDIVVSGSSNETPTTTPTPTVAPTLPPQEAVETPITSITYDFDITGVTSESSLNFLYTTNSWNGGTAVLPLNGNGSYSITININNESGMKNMGYFDTIAGSQIIANLTKVTINETYDLNASASLCVGSSTENGWKNIWNLPDAGTKIAEGTGGYIALNNDKSALVFYRY